MLIGTPVRYGATGPANLSFFLSLTKKVALQIRAVPFASPGKHCFFGPFPTKVHLSKSRGSDWWQSLNGINASHLAHSRRGSSKHAVNQDQPFYHNTNNFAFALTDIVIVSTVSPGRTSTVPYSHKDIGSSPTHHGRQHRFVRGIHPT